MNQSLRIAYKSFFHAALQRISTCVLLAFFISFTFSSPAFSNAGDASKKPRILLIYSYHPSFPTSAKVLAGMRSVLPVDRYEIDIEYMDSKRFLDDTLLSNFHSSLAYKLSKRAPYDVVISADDNAFNFLLQRRASLLPGVPLVFLGVNNVEKAISMNDVEDVTGVAEAASFAKTISLSSRLFPTRKNIWFLVDNTPSGQADMATINNQRKLFPELSFKVLSLAELSWDEWQVAIADKGKDDVIMLLSAYRDRNNKGKSFDQSLSLLVNSSQVPIFHFWEHGLGAGVVGGHIVSHFEQGKQAALMAKRIMLGEAAASIEVMGESPNIPTFDAQMLEQFGVDIDLLPEHSRLINLPEKYVKYRRYLMVSIAVVSVFLVIFVITIRFQRKVAHERGLLRQLIDATPDFIVISTKDQRIAASNKAYRNFAPDSTRVLIDDFRHLPNGRTEVWVTHQNGHRMLLDIFKSALFDRKKRNSGAILIGRDVTERYYSDARLKRNEELLASTQKLARIGSWEYEITTKNFVCTETLCEIFGIRCAMSALDKDEFLNCIPVAERQDLMNAYKRLSDEQSSVQTTHRIVSADNVEKYVCTEFGRTYDEDNNEKLFGVVYDVTRQYRDQAKIRHIAVVFEQASEAIILLDKRRFITDVNAAFEKLTGFSSKEAVGKKPSIIHSSRYSPQFYQDVWSEVERAGQWQGEIWRKRKNGSEYPEWLTISQIHSDHGELDGYVLLSSDISLLKQSEEKLDYLAHHDVLTGLPNRLLLKLRMEHSLERARRENTQVAILFLDLDGFKHINDSLGHAIGDELLRKISNQLRQRVREEDTIARIGGDEFVVVMEHIREIEQINTLVGQLIAGFQPQHQVHGHQLRVTASIGVSVYPKDGEDGEILLRNADSAMYKAKEKGRNNFQFYAPDFTHEARERIELESEIATALQTGQFVVYYQPQVDLKDGCIRGVEALVRWLHPTRGQVSPAQFISLAELNGQIIELGAFVLRTACEQWVEWHKKGCTLQVIAVNFSARQFADSGLANHVKSILEETGCPASRLEIEVTEGYLMKDVNQSINILKELRELGCLISIDDFGTGYSSLSYLKRMPVHRLKIDRSFVMDLARDDDDKGIARAVIALAASLGLEVVAEGIETMAQFEFLKAEGCQLGQGYLFSPAIPAASFEEFFKKFSENSDGSCSGFRLPFDI